MSSFFTLYDGRYMMLGQGMQQCGVATLGKSKAHGDNMFNKMQQLPITDEQNMIEWFQCLS
jgi:hypothetical protein